VDSSTKYLMALAKHWAKAQLFYDTVPLAKASGNSKKGQA
jgi:hypothetical protein